MPSLEFFRKWQNARRERRIEERNALEERRIEALTAQAADLTEDQPCDLLELQARGFVRATARGQCITEIQAALENLVRKKINLIIKPGTFFVASGDHQNMATTAKYTFTLLPCSVQNFKIEVVCINASKRIPGELESFEGVSKVSVDVARFLEAAGGENPMVIQAGVWTLTDNLGYWEVRERLIAKDYVGPTPQQIRNEFYKPVRTVNDVLSNTGSLQIVQRMIRDLLSDERAFPITSAHCLRAMTILKELGISNRL